MENNLLYKQNKNKEFTSDDKSWFEEGYGREPSVKASEIWADAIPTVPPNDIHAESNVIKYVDINMTEDFTTPNHKAWFACQFQGILSSRFYDFIAPSKTYSEKYLVDITDADGKPLKMGAEIDWNFDYSNGILTFRNSGVPYKAPFRLKGWRYIGKKGVTGGIGSFGDNVAGSLQAAYYNGPEIATLMGPVTLSASGGFAPLQLTEMNETPFNSLQTGQMFVRDGIPFIYNATIGKFISISTETIQFTAKRASGVYLATVNKLTEWTPMRECYITNISAKISSGFLTKNIKITSGVNTILDFNLVNGKYTVNNQNIAIQKNKPLRIKASSLGDMSYDLVITLEIAQSV
jgi:hypothetical protein